MNNLKTLQNIQYIQNNENEIVRSQQNNHTTNFCGYSTLKQTLPRLVNATNDDIIYAITNSLDKSQIKSLITMHCNKIMRVNSDEFLNEELAKLGYETTEGDTSKQYLQLEIMPHKLNSCWKNINEISNLSYEAISWKTILTAGTILATTHSITDTNFSGANLVFNTIFTSVVCVGAKYGYNLVSNIISSKPWLYQVRQKHKIHEHVLCQDLIGSNNNDATIASGELSKSFIKMDNLPIIFDNLSNYLGVSKKQIPSLFGAMLVGIVDTWIELTTKQEATNELELNESIINTKIIENTLLAIIIDIRLVAHYRDLPAADETPYAPFVDIKKNLNNTLDNLQEGFYTVNAECLCALHIKNNVDSKKYCLFMPANNLVYTTSSVTDITKKLLTLREDSNIVLTKIAGKL